MYFRFIARETATLLYIQDFDPTQEDVTKNVSAST